MYPIPSNVLPYLIGVPVVTYFGWRALKNYRRLHNPLSGYFAWTGFLAGLTFACWSLPLFFTRDSTILAISNIIADFFLACLYIVNASLVYYLALQSRFSKKLFMTPFIVLAIVGWLANSYSYWHDGVAVVDGLFTYTLSSLSLATQVILLTNLFIVGIMLLSKLSELSTGRSRTSLIGVSALYLLSALAGLLNVAMSGQAPTSHLVQVSYIIGFVVFVSVLVAVRFIKPVKSTKS